MRTTVKAHLPGDSGNLATLHASGHKKEKQSCKYKDAELPRDAKQWDPSGATVAVSLSALQAPRGL